LSFYCTAFYSIGKFETNVQITKEMFDLGGGHGVRLCGCAGIVNDLGEQSCGSCRIAEECGDLNGGSSGSGSGSGSSGSGSGSGSGTSCVSGTCTTTGASSGLAKRQDNGQGGAGQGGAGTSGINQNGTTTSNNDKGGAGSDVKANNNGSGGLNDPGVIALIVIMSLVGCLCITVAILTIPHKTGVLHYKRKTMASRAKMRKSMDAVKKINEVELTSIDSIARREALADKLNGSQWWYIDMEGEEQGPCSSAGKTIFSSRKTFSFVF
jgi:hypothetical protein